MRYVIIAFLPLFALHPALAQEHTKSASLPMRLGSCYAPVEPFPYKLEKTDPLYETARDEHQRYLEELESYVNCLDQERAGAFEELRASFDLFMENFGRDAVLKYAQEKEASTN